MLIRERGKDIHTRERERKKRKERERERERERKAAIMRCRVLCAREHIRLRLLCLSDT